MYTYIHIITINEKIGHGFIGEHEGIYGRIWKKERDGVNHDEYPVF